MRLQIYVYSGSFKVRIYNQQPCIVYSEHANFIIEFCVAENVQHV